MSIRRDATPYRMYFGYKRRRPWLLNVIARALRRLVPSNLHQDAHDR
jgi:hypothetical protein